ncbi:MAG: amidoligase family protein [Archangium sp.]|nr:amidoligase family protein [Archangium sp.]
MIRRTFGLEIELLAPVGGSRDDLAKAVATTFGGRLRFGWKYHGAGHLPDGRPDCQLSPATRVEARGRWVASFVDDPTIVDDLRPGAGALRMARTDDVRLAAWLERHGWSSRPALEARLRTTQRTFGGTFDEDGLVDPWGLPLVRWHRQSVERARVCEVVLRPLAPKEQRRVVTAVLSRAASLGFTVPAEAALHVHADAAPFRSTEALKHLVLEWSRTRKAWLARLKPNPRCRKLGPYADDVVRVAKEAAPSLPFETLAAAMVLAGLKREVDLNLLGLVDRFPKQPTVEVRCLPCSLDADATMARLELVESLLDALSLPR